MTLPRRTGTPSLLVVPVRGLVRETVPEVGSLVSSMPAANTEVFIKIDRTTSDKKMKINFFIDIFYKLSVFLDYITFKKKIKEKIVIDFPLVYS